MTDKNFSNFTQQNAQYQGTLFSLWIFAIEMPLGHKKEAITGGIL